MAPQAGLAHVGAVSFLAARVAPTGSFFLSLAGGASLAREAALRGMRAGYASSAAAMLETVAIVGPLRFNAPLTQAMTAPLLGAMETRGRRPWTQFLACLAIRLAHYTVLTVFAAFILIGAKAYAGSYKTLFGWLPFLPGGLAGALILTAIGNVLFGIFFSVVQVNFYRHALAGWDRWTSGEPPQRHARPVEVPQAGGMDPRIALVVATVVTVVLLFSHSWPVLAAVSAWLAVASIAARHGDRDVLKVGLVLALTLAAGTLVASLIGGLGADEAASRTVRAALLVMVPTWLRLVTSSAGLREAFRRMLLFLRLRIAREAGETLSELDSGPLLVSTAKALRDHMKGVEHTVLAISDAVLSWAANEARSVPVVEPRPAALLRLRRGDAILAVSVLLPAGALAAILVP